MPFTRSLLTPPPPVLLPWRVILLSNMLVLRVNPCLCQSPSEPRRSRSYAPRLYPARLIAPSHLVAETVSLEIAFHRLLFLPARHHDQSRRSARVGLNEPRGRGGDAREIRLTFREHLQRQDRVDVVVGSAGAQHGLEQHFGVH